MKDFIFKVGSFISVHFDKLAMLVLLGMFVQKHDADMTKEVFVALMVLIKGSGTISQK